MAKRSQSGSPRDKRRMRTQQIIFAIIAAIIILSWVIGLIVN